MWFLGRFSPPTTTHLHSHKATHASASQKHLCWRGGLGGDLESSGWWAGMLQCHWLLVMFSPGFCYGSKISVYENRYSLVCILQVWCFHQYWAGVGRERGDGRGHALPINIFVKLSSEANFVKICCWKDGSLVEDKSKYCFSTNLAYSTGSCFVLYQSYLFLKFFKDDWQR